MQQVIANIVSRYTPETVSALWIIGQRVVVPAWIGLLIAPTNALTRQVVKIAIAVNSFLYVALLPSLFFNPKGNFSAPDFGSWAGILGLFRKGSEGGLLAAWVHYLAFDLFVGWKIAQDAARNGIPRIVTALAIVSTLMAGPTGLMVYLLIRILAGASTEFIPWK